MSEACVVMYFVKVTRHDGEASLEMEVKNLPRVPVAGDCVLAFPKSVIDADVKRVTLCQGDEDTLPTVWVHLDDDDDLENDEDRDEFWECNIPAGIRSQVDFYIQEGWSLANGEHGQLRTVWDGKWDSPWLGMAVGNEFPGLLKYMDGDMRLVMSA